MRSHDWIEGYRTGLRHMIAGAIVIVLALLAFGLVARGSRMATLRVTTPAELKAAVIAAEGGDVILVAPGFYIVGTLLLPPKGGLVTLRSEDPLPDRRVTPDDVLPTLISGNGQAVINGSGASNWLLQGLAFAPNPSGDGEVITLQDSTNIELDRIRIVGGDTNGQKRGVRGNGQGITLRRSHLANIWRTGQDSQAFCAWDGAGPYRIEDNYLEAASENIMFGGAASRSVDRLPSDIRIVGNTITKPLAWKGIAGRNVKNLLELKVGRRVHISGNTLSNNWTQGQNGYGILIKSVNQAISSTVAGPAPWSVTEDVMIVDNTLTGSEHGFNLLGITNGIEQAGQTTRVTLRNNSVSVSGTALQVGGNVGSLVIDRNTFAHGGNFMALYGSPYAVESLTVTNTVAAHNQYGIKGDGTGIGNPTLTRYVKALTWAYVFLDGASLSLYPPGTTATLPLPTGSDGAVIGYTTPVAPPPPPCLPTQIEIAPGLVISDNRKCG